MKNIGKRFCAFILCCVLGITAASAATNYSGRPSTKPFTADELEVKTNSLNQSYGEAFVAKKMNLDLDLISAVGQNGVEGYIYSSELPHNIANYVPYDHEINVYASDGITVVDSFYISAGTPNSAE